MTSKLSVEQANDFLRSAVMSSSHKTVVTQMTAGCAIQRLEVDERNLRPGGYISGPTQMAIADGAAYFAVLSLIGMQPMAVTSNLSINFLRPCLGQALIAEARVIKIGQTLAVMEVDIRAEGGEKPSSHAIVTYALPKSDPS